MPLVHVAILKRAYANLVLEGRKVIESRLSLRGGAPFGSAFEGDRIFIKVSGGAIVGTGVIERALHVSGLTPRDVTSLRRRYDHLILGTDEYWASKSLARFATLLWLGRVEACERGPNFRSWPMYAPRRAWFTGRFSHRSSALRGAARFSATLQS